MSHFDFYAYTCLRSRIALKNASGQKHSLNIPLKIAMSELVNSQAPELSRGPRARSARSGENGEGEVRSL